MEEFETSSVTWTVAATSWAVRVWHRAARRRRQGVAGGQTRGELGHHFLAFTLDTYAHVLPGTQAEAAEDLADLVFGEEPQNEKLDEPEDDGSADAS